MHTLMYTFTQGKPKCQLMESCIPLHFHIQKEKKNSNPSIDIYQLCALSSHFAGKFALNKDVPTICEVGHVKNKAVWMCQAYFNK